MQDESTRQPFPDATDVPHDGRAAAGASDAPHTPLQIRSLDGRVDPVLHAWIHERLGRQLGKFATQIERIEVRFTDESGRKSGIEHTCLIHVVLSTLPPLAVEEQAAEPREAFDLAAGKTERALKHTLQKHGFSVGHKGRHHPERGEEALNSAADESGPYPVSDADEASASASSVTPRRDALPRS